MALMKPRGLPRASEWRRLSSNPKARDKSRGFIGHSTFPTRSCYHPSMTLGRRLATQIVLLLACLALTAVVGWWGIYGLRQDFTIARDNHERLKQLYSVSTNLQLARTALNSEFPSKHQAFLNTRRAYDEMKRLAPSLPVSPQDQEALVGMLRLLVERVSRSPAVDFGPALQELRGVEALLRRQVDIAEQQADERKRQALWYLTVAGGAALLTGLALGIKQWSAVMKPLSSIKQGVHRIAGAKFDKPITVPRGTDREFVELARDFNEMAGQLESMYGQMQKRVEASTRSLVQSERLAGVGMLAAGVAHEINNPLAIITGRIELLMARPLDESTRSGLKIALDEAFRCKQIIDRLLSLSRGPSGRRDATRLDELAADVANNVRALPGAKGRSIEIIKCDEVTALVDQGEIKQVLLNLLINAIQATPEGGQIDVSVCRAGAWAEMTVTDNGAGMDRGTLERLFEPFYSARPTEQRGTGLGLTITKAIVESHGGAIEADSDGPGTGSRFVVRLPVQTEAVAA